MMTNPLRCQIKNDLQFILGFHHLIGFAAELYLKAFLLQRGVSEAELRSQKYGHKLHVLLENAEAHGLVCPAARSLCGYLEKHSTYEYRYMNQAAAYDLRPLDQIFNDFSDLDIAIDQAVGASESKGVAVGQRWIFPQDAKLWWIGEA